MRQLKQVLQNEIVNFPHLILMVNLSSLKFVLDALLIVVYTPSRVSQITLRGKGVRGVGIPPSLGNS